MKEDQDDGSVICIILGAVVVCLCVAGIRHGPCEDREDIIKAGCGEYVIVDQATGRTEFRLKEVK